MDNFSQDGKRHKCKVVRPQSDCIDHNMMMGIWVLKNCGNCILGLHRPSNQPDGCRDGLRGGGCNCTCCGLLENLDGRVSRREGSNAVRVCYGRVIIIIEIGRHVLGDPVVVD